MAKILVGYVPNAEGRAAVDAGVREARLRDAELVVTQHVALTPSDEGGSETLEVRERLETLAKELRGQTSIDVRTEWSVGPISAARALLALAEEEQPDLIVIGIRRRSPVGKALMGSNSQDVLLRADCPVLAVKAD